MQATILSSLLILAHLVGTAVSHGRIRREPAILDDRVRLYRRTIVWWSVRVIPGVLVAYAAGLSLTDLGLAPTGGLVGETPDGAVLAWGLTVFFCIATVGNGFHRRRNPRPGQVPQRSALPRTTRERRLAAVLSITGGAAEEIFFRGVLLVLGIEVFHLSTPVAALLSLALATSAYAYQGRPAALGAALIGAWFTATTLMAGSILPAIALHITIALVGTLVASPQPNERAADGTQPSTAR